VAQESIPDLTSAASHSFMRVNSAAYKRFHARKYRKRKLDIKKLCARLDKLVFRAEKLKSGRTRLEILNQADKVRDKLRTLEH
jgi:hypothetical protein